MAWIALLAIQGGCAGPRPILETTPEVRTLPMFDGATGEPVNWADLIDRAEHAEVVFVGEEHDDSVAHAAEQAIVNDSIEMLSGRTAVSMEMLERNEQPLVDRYLEGSLDVDSFIRETDSGRWSREGLWESWYQPLIDAARAAGTPVVAANAPREFLRMTKTMSFEEMRALPEQAAGLFDVPLTYDTNLVYRRRFLEVMGAPTEPGPQSAEEAAPAHPAAAPDASNPHAGPMTYEMGLEGLRSQMIWDATMASAIARCLEGDAAERVVHVVGRFHVEHDGGTVSEFRARRPQAVVLNIIVSSESATSLREEDRGAGDIVMYTGTRESQPPAR